LFDHSHYAESLGPEENVELPLQHYLSSGWQRNGSPFPLFDQAFFLSQNPNVRNEVNPYAEYLSDFSHSFSPNKFFDPAFYSLSGMDGGFKGSLLEHFVRFGAAVGARPHRLVAVTNACPSIHSGFDPVQCFRDDSGRQIWLCSPVSNKTLISSLEDMRELEASLPSDFLDQCTLHPYNGPIDAQGRLLIEIMRKTARCNCLVVSEDALDEEMVSGLFSPSAFLVSNSRPWLTLFSCSDLTIRYWHSFHGCKASIKPSSPTDMRSDLEFISRVLLAAIPNKLVLRTDPFGLTLLRTCGRQIFAIIPQVSLLIGSADLRTQDQQWISEYIASNYSEFASLIVCGDRAAELVACWEIVKREDTPRVVRLS
jgi:hypothetical protein